MSKSFRNIFAEAKKRESFWKQKIILNFTAELNSLLNKRGISRKEYAALVGSSQAYITKVFKGNANFTVESMVKLAFSIGGEISIHITPKEEKGGRTWFGVIEGQGTSAEQEWQVDPEVEEIQGVEIATGVVYEHCA
jgi:transcriptional regulator with XRE-family HTH domain